MAGREIPLVTGEYYHVFNRGISDIDTFKDEADYYHAIDTISYYLQEKPPVRFSYFIRLPYERKYELILQKKFKPHRISLLAFCLMPNHFHFLVKQTQEEGVSSFLGLITNSYTKYFNKRHRRHGPIFQGTFKAVQIESREQLIHVSRYIHLNPTSSGIVKRFGDLKNYKYSSFNNYLNPQVPSICDTTIILSMFPSLQRYLEFISDNTDYQKYLETVKHLVIDVDL